MGLTGTTDTDNFYDLWTDLFLRGFGTVFQAGLIPAGNPAREDPEASVLALAERAGLRAGDRILDAGCGVAGPAIIIATHYPNTEITGVTNSAHQVRIAERQVDKAGLLDRVRVHQADYQNLPFESGSFDQVLFFESTGYSTDLDKTYREAFRVLKPGGRIYVKDVFRVGGTLGPDEVEQMEAFDRLWGCSGSKTRGETVDSITHAGFQVTLDQLIAEIGTSRFAGSMFDLRAGGLELSGLGKEFLVRGLDPPIEFGEVGAIKATD